MQGVLATSNALSLSLSLSLSLCKRARACVCDYLFDSILDHYFARLSSKIRPPSLSYLSAYCEIRIFQLPLCKTLWNHSVTET